MNIKTPVTVDELDEHSTADFVIYDAGGQVVCMFFEKDTATKLAAIINLHGELVQFVKHISERAGIESVERHQAYELLAKCEQVWKGETP